MTVKRQKLSILCVYCACFYAAWACFELLFKSSVDSALIKSGIIKNLVWTLPALWLIFRHPQMLLVKPREMFTRKVHWLRFLPVFAACAAYILAGAVIQRGGIALSPDFSWDHVVVVLFVGITEESVFRGWLLNATATDDKRWLAVLINALMFLAIHFPRWIAEGLMLANLLNFGFIGIMLVSVVFSVAFLKSRNLFVPILLHMFWDLLMFMLF